MIKVCVSGSDGKSLSVEEEAASIVQGTYKINKVAHYFFFFEIKTNNLFTGGLG